MPSLFDPFRIDVIEAHLGTDIYGASMPCCVRLPPSNKTPGMRGSKLVPVLTATLDAPSATGIVRLQPRKLPLDGRFGMGDPPPLAAQLRHGFTGLLIAGSDCDPVRAQAALGEDAGNAVAFGRRLMANPGPAFAARTLRATRWGRRSEVVHARVGKPPERCGSRGSGAAVARCFMSAAAQVAFSMPVPRRLTSTKPRQQGTKPCTRTTRAVVPSTCSW
jgi:hypothetical protein